jgi:hypothetical protein
MVDVSEALNLGGRQMGVGSKESKVNRAIREALMKLDKPDCIAWSYGPQHRGLA